MTMSLSKRIATGTLYASLSTILIRAFSLCSYILLLKKLPVHDYGVVVLIFASVAPAWMFIFWGLDRTFVSEFGRSLGQKNFAGALKLFREYYAFIIFMSLLFVGGTLLLRELLQNYFPYILEYTIQIIFFVISQVFLNMTLLFLESNSELKKISVFESCESLFRFAIIIGLFFFNSLNISTVIFAYSIAKFFAGLVAVPSVIKTYVFLRTSKHYNEKFNVPVLLNVVKKFGKWDVFANFGEGLFNTIKIWAIKIFINIQAVAYYDFAQNIFGILVSLVPVRKVIYPFIASSIKDLKTVKFIISKSRKYLLFIYIFMVAGMVFVLPLAIEYIFPAYKESIPLVLLFMIKLFLDVFSLGHAPLLSGLRKQNFKFLVQVVSLPVGIILYILFVYWFGLIGSVLSGLALVLFKVVVEQWYIEKKLHIKTWDIKSFLSFDAYDRILIEKIKGMFLGILKRKNS